MNVRLLFLALGITCTAAFAAPSVTNTLPIPGNSVANLTTVSITFNEPVAGVDAEDLLINNESAASVSGSGAGPYVFTFTQPPPGLVSVSWEFDHGIAGLGTGAFVPGSGWTYTLNDTLAPTVGKWKTSVAGQEMDSVVPSPNATVGVLTAVEVTFSESVIGVDASDLLVGGVPATTVTGSDSGPYVFSCAQPPAGPVTIAWAGGHGITDTASNAFGGGSWNVTLSAAGAGSLVISEFLAANASINPADENGDFSDWLEIQNTGATPVNLLGWSLSDDADDPNRWVFPNRTLNAGAYMIVYTSGKDRKPVSGRMHTNFNLSIGGGSIYLYPPNGPRGAAASAYEDYPVQRYNYSYGRQPGGALRYFATPTPEAANPVSALTSVAAMPTFSVSRGFFKDPFNVILSSPDAAATVRYTLDGSVPIASSTAYSTPIQVSNTTVLRAAAFSSSRVPSDTVTHSYIFLDNLLTQGGPPYDNPALVGDEANPALPTVSNIPFANGGVRFPISWGSNGSFTAGNTFVTNLGGTGIVPADYGMDPEIINDPNKYDDNGVINPTTGKLNLDRIKQGFRDLPLMSIVMKNDDMFGPAGLYPNSTQKGTTYEKPCSIELLLPDGSSGIASTCGIRIHGNASRNPQNTPKHGFKLNFKSTFGASSLAYALFPDSPVEEFDDIILRADYNSGWLHWDGSGTFGTFNGAGVSGGQRGRGTRLRDAFCKDTFRAMGYPAGHHRYVHLFINGVYWGVYDPTEQQNSGFAAAYYGGEKEDYDVIEQGAVKSGTMTAYNAMLAIAPPIDNPKYEQMKGYLDVPQFADYMLLHFWLGHQDWGDDVNKNWYTVRNAAKNSTFRYLPWDMENLMWDVNVDRTGVASPASGLHPKLVTNPQYLLDFADRVNKHVLQPDGVLQSTNSIARWNKWRSILTNAIACESARWGDYRRDVHQNSSGPYPLYTWNNQWIFENTRLTSTTQSNGWFNNRNTNLSNPAQGLLPQLRSRGLYPMLNAPEYRNNANNALIGSQTVTPGFQVKLQFPVGSSVNTSNTPTTNAGTFYYTTDGSDPRVYYDTTGQRTPTAVAYTTPITINSSTTIKARTLNGTTWSALSEIRLNVGSPKPSIQITEIHYNPPAAQGGSSVEFIEIQNTGASTVDLGGWAFSGVELIIPYGTSLGAGERMVFASNNGPNIFAAQYPGVFVTAYFGASLSNSGEEIALYDVNERRISSVTYQITAPWPTTANGGGFSLEIIDPLGDSLSPFNWKASNAVKGTPGAPNSSPAASDIRISEFFAKNTGGYNFEGTTPGYVELANTSGSPVDITNWQLFTEQGTALAFPGGSVIPANGFLAVHFTPQNVSGLRAPQILNDQAGRIFLRNASNVLVDGVQYGPQAANFSFHRNGSAWQLGTPTPGAANVAATVAAQSNLRINEWLANPKPGYDDWLEIANPAGQPVVLTGLHVTTSTELFRIVVPAAIGAGEYQQWFCRASATAGNYLDFNLPSSGTTVSLLDTAGTLANSIAFGAQTENVTQGRLPNATGAATTLPYPSPALANYAVITGGPVLNEVLMHNVGGDNAPWANRAGWLELRNPNPAPVALTGWSLRNPLAISQRWSFPTGATIPALGYLALWSDATQAPSTTNALNLNCVFPNAVGALDNYGFELVNPSGQVVDRITWGKQITDLSIGRLPDNSWTLLSAPTRGSANAAAATLGAASDVRINEWYATGNGSLFDYIELYNTSPLPVALGGLYLSDEPSEVGRRKYQFPALTFIPGTGFVSMIAEGSANATSIGYSLSADGEYLRLAQSNDTQLEAIGFGLQAPGTAQGRQPEGSTTTATFVATPDAPNSTGTGPTITRHPRAQAVAAGGSVALTVAASGATSYQWKRDNSDVPGANSDTLLLDPVSLADDGVYTCVVTGASASNTSLPARLTVLFTYELWADRFGLVGAQRDGLEDIDDDGLTNFGEFLVDSDPMVSATGAERATVHPVVGAETSGGVITQLTLQMRLNRRAAFNAWTGELAASPAGIWTPTAPSSVEVLSTEPDGDQNLRIKFPVPNGSTKHFLRQTLEP